jgi:hypothetical protein
VRTNGCVAIFPYLLSQNMASNKLNFDAVLDLLDNENNNSDSGDISSDEEEDLNRLLAVSGSIVATQGKYLYVFSEQMLSCHGRSTQICIRHKREV